jgi:pimeloyl-ACP methyl ester carboxylesterase
MNVLYFHGFASSPMSQKLVALKELLKPDVTVNSPDMNVPSFEHLAFDAMVSLALTEGRRTPPDVIVGSSLGSLVALELVRRGVLAPLVLIAPAVGIGERWLTKLPAGDPIEVFNHALNRKAPVHRAFFERMAAIRPEEHAPKTRVTIIMGRNDESVPFDLVRGVWDDWTQSGELVSGSRFVEIAGGDHGLVAYTELIAQLIRGERASRPQSARVSRVDDV